MRARLRPVAALVFACAVSCDSSPKGGASAAASAPPPPPCTDALPRPEQIARCERGEALCCTAMMAGTPKDAPDYWDKLGLACSGGAETSCEIVRDSDRSAAYKLDAFDKACTVMGRWPCRMSAMLAIVTASPRAPAIVDNYCRQTDDKTFRISTASIKCDPADTSAIAELAPMATACRGGDLPACKTLAGVDGNARELFYDIAWQARGLPRDEIEKRRVQVTQMGAAEPKGSVDFKVQGGNVTGPLAEALGLRQQELRRCLGWARENEPRAGGQVRYRVLIDKSRRIATAEVEGKDLENTALSECFRGVLQDSSIAGELDRGPAGDDSWLVDLIAAGR